MECVVLAAGEGKRMRPLTAKRPKVMLPLANRPMMEHLILAARDAGITEFVFVVGYGEREIRGHFGDGSAFGIHIRYASQRQQRGTADALRSAHDLVTGPFILLNGDMILKSTDIAGLCTCRAPCMSISTTDHPEDYGAVMVEHDRVTALRLLRIYLPAPNLPASPLQEHASCRSLAASRCAVSRKKNSANCRMT